jgi:hypothetical protein
MDFTHALVNKINILEQIENNEGEITTDQENFLARIERQLPTATDDYAIWYKNLKHLEEDNRAMYLHRKALIDQVKDRASRLLIPVLEKIGRQKTAYTSIGVITKSSERIVIDDFDLVMRIYPECITIETSEDKTERTWRISKTKLKEVGLGFDSPRGWHVEISESKYIDARVK